MKYSIGLWVLCVCALPAYAIVAPRQGGPLPPAYFEAKGKDPGAFRMRAAWILTAERLRDERDAAIRGGASSAASIADVPKVSGEFSFPVLLGQFVNQSAPYSPGVLRQKLFTGPFPTGTLAGYYNEVSYGNLAVTGVVTDWVTTLQQDMYYEGASNGLVPNDAKTGEFLKELLEANDGSIDFGAFDNDGPDGVPNSGDDDGYADLVVFVHSESGGECSAFSANIWSHSWLYRAWPISGGAPFTTNDASANGGFVRVDDYVIEPSVSCGGGAVEIGGFCHEVGHALGLPDLFDTDGGSSGAGHWDLMALGNWNTPDSPAHLSAWSRAELGWVFPQVVGWQGGVASIPQIETSSVCYLLPFTDDRFRRTSECAIDGAYSLRCGLTAAEAAARGWVGGSGYGNGWQESAERSFVYDGTSPAIFSYTYAHDVEPGQDSALVYLNLGTSRVLLADYTGLGSGTAIVDLTSYLASVTVPAAYSLEFRVVSDPSWSDEDGKHLTTCGAFTVDNVSVAGGGESYATGFETSVDGWYQDPSKNPSTEYWMVENRQPAGFDAHLHESGLLVWHVDEEIIRSALGNTGGPGNAMVRGLVLEEADGVGQLLQDPATTGNEGDAGDPYPGSTNHTVFDGSSVPNSMGNSDVGTQIEASGISTSGSTMTAFLRAGDSGPVAASVTPKVLNNDLTSVDINVTGNGFRPGASLRLTRSGEADIVPRAVSWRDPLTLTGDFNIFSKKGGVWNVVAENPDGQQSVLAGSLTIVQIVATKLVSAVIDLSADGRVEILLELRDREDGESLVLSRAADASGPWQTLDAPCEQMWANVYRFIDDSVEPGNEYFYRLDVRSAQGEMRELYQGHVEIPQAPFALELVAPNPFNPSTTISFSLRGASVVKLEIYDVSGRIVRTLESGPLPAGRHSRVWDGRVASGGRASSGIYVCRLRAGTSERTTKLLLLK